MHLQYNLHKLDDPADRAALFDDIKHAGGIAAHDVPPFLAAVDRLLSDAYTYRQTVEDAREDALRALALLQDLIDDAPLYPAHDLQAQATTHINTIRKELDRESE